LRRAAYAYYEQDDHRYLELSSDTHHEIVGFTGNISLRDDKPFLHAHATFADAAGATVGGHLLRGCEVFAAEVMIREITGVSLVRMPDEKTGLALW
jgi:predicted DNA-binding protein with PD1-like motif